MSVVVISLIALFLTLYLWIKKHHNYWINRGFASAPAIFPIGSIKDVGTKVSLLEKFDDFYKEFKATSPAVGIFFLLKPTLLVIDPVLIRLIFVKDFASFHDRYVYYNKKDDPISAHMLALDGAEWRERRVKLTPTFTSAKMKTIFDLVDEIGDRFVRAIDKELQISNALEMHELLARFTTDIIGSVAFGIECNCLEDPNTDFRKFGKKSCHLDAVGMFKFIFTSMFPDISRKLGIPLHSRDVIDFFVSTFLQTIEYREKNNIKRNDFIQLLLGLKETSSLTNLELAAEGFIFYIGGFETSSSLLTFLLYEMALNPDIQDRLRDEIKSALDDNDGKLTYDVLSELKYLDMVINETLRKYPPVFFLTRKSNKDFVIPETKLIIPKGTHINIPVFSLHRDPEYYPDPEKYDPERFTPENIKTRQPCTFMAFGKI